MARFAGKNRIGRLGQAASKRRRRKGGEPEPVPVKPKNPKDLTGGAAVELEFDE